MAVTMKLSNEKYIARCIAVHNVKQREIENLHSFHSLSYLEGLRTRIFVVEVEVEAERVQLASQEPRK